MLTIQHQSLDKLSETVYNKTVSLKGKMQYLVEDEKGKLHGTFYSVTDLELYMDGVRNSRGDRYKELPILSCFDYIKSIGWHLTIKDKHSMG